MTEAAPPVVAPLAAPSAPRLRLRLVTLLLLGGVWVMPWFGAETGASRAGAPGALAFALAWGLAATLSVARTREGLALGEAATSLAVAALAAALAAAGHPWLKGGESASSLVPVFVPLALVCALDVALRIRGLRAAQPGTGREVTVLRAGAALLAGASLLAAMRFVPAAAALAVGLLPMAAHLPKSIASARRALEGASLVAAAALFLAPEAHQAVAHVPESAEAATVWAFAYRLFSLGLGAIAALGVFGAGEADAQAAAPSPR